MRVEMKGLWAALAAGLLAVGASYGVSSLLAAPTPGRASSQEPKLGAAAQLVSTGHGFYTESCASCHGSKGQGGIGPRLAHTDLSDAQIAATIKNGVKGQMPAYGAQYGDPQIQALTAYLRSLK